jgi:geranylgeranyl pyrophosphate synthase
MALVHDDIMDEAEKRHNAMTIHAYIETLMSGPNKHHI